MLLYQPTSAHEVAPPPNAFTIEDAPKIAPIPIAVEMAKPHDTLPINKETPIKIIAKAAIDFPIPPCASFNTLHNTVSILFHL